MKKVLLLIWMGLLGTLVFTQNPGNVGTANLTAWFKADNLVPGNATAWSTTFPAGGSALTLNDFAAPYAQVTATPPGATSNYNTTIDFIGNTAAGPRVLENTSALNLLDNTFVNNQGTFFSSYYLPAASITAGCHVINYREGTSGTVDGIQFRVKLGTGTGRLAIGTGSNSTFASHDFAQDFRPDIVSYKGNRTGPTTHQTFRRSLSFTGGGASGTTGSQGLHVGARRSGTNYNGLFDGFISELIFYNRDLTANEMNRVHTYLAVKYAVTLDNAGGGTQGDYLSTTSTIVWDASLGAIYHNEVIGIGRDDTEALLQKQSHTFDDHTRIYLNTLQPTNAANTGTFTANESYVIIGNNAAANCATTASNAETPATPFLYARLAREWKVTKTNFAQDFNLDLTLDTCAVPGPIDVNDLRLLIDDDGNFGNATVLSAGGGLGISYAQGVVTITGISAAQIPNNATRYLTLGYSRPVVTLTGGGTFCEGDSVPLHFGITGATGPVSVTYSDGGNLFTVPNLVDGDSVMVSPSIITTYSVTNVSSFSCCGQQISSSATFFVNPRPTVTANATATTICAGDSVQLTGAGATTYTWDNGVTDGDFVNPPTSVSYTVIGADANQCTDTARVTINVNPTPVVVAQATSTVICIGDSVQLTATGATSYVWDNGVIDGDFVSPTLTTTYAVVGTNGANCVDSSAITVTVNPLPNVMAITTADSVCEGESVVLSGAGATSYVWDNGITDNQAFAPSATTTYTVIGTDANNCVDSASVTITFLPVISFSLGEDTVICPGLPIVLQAAPNFGFYQWQDGSGQDTFFVTEPGTYSLAAADSAGCVYSDEIVIEPEVGCDSLFIPNVFTPNGDGFNDRYVLEGDYVNTFDILIFDRWGRLMFHSEDLENTWDGTGIGGSACAESTYYYVVRYSFLGEPETLLEDKGHVTLLR